MVPRTVPSLTHEKYPYPHHGYGYMVGMGVGMGPDTLGYTHADAYVQSYVEYIYASQ